MHNAHAGLHSETWTTHRLGTWGKQKHFFNNNNNYCPVYAVPVKHAPSSKLGMFHIILRKHVVHVGNSCLEVHLHIPS